MLHLQVVRDLQHAAQEAGRALVGRLKAAALVRAAAPTCPVPKDTRTQGAASAAVSLSEQVDMRRGSLDWRGPAVSPRAAGGGAPQQIAAQMAARAWGASRAAHAPPSPCTHTHHALTHPANKVLHSVWEQHL